MAISLSSFLNAPISEPNRCNDCGKEHASGEPLGPYIVKAYKPPECGTCGRPFPGGRIPQPENLERKDVPIIDGHCSECGQKHYPDEPNR